MVFSEAAVETANVGKGVITKLTLGKDVCELRDIVDEVLPLVDDKSNEVAEADDVDEDNGAYGTDVVAEGNTEDEDTEDAEDTVDAEDKDDVTLFGDFGELLR